LQSCPSLCGPCCALLPLYTCGRFPPSLFRMSLTTYNTLSPYAFSKCNPLLSESRYSPSPDFTPPLRYVLGPFSQLQDSADLCPLVVTPVEDFLLQLDFFQIFPSFPGPYAVFFDVPRRPAPFEPHPSLRLEDCSCLPYSSHDSSPYFFLPPSSLRLGCLSL